MDALPPSRVALHEALRDLALAEERVHAFLDTFRGPEHRDAVRRVLDALDRIDLARRDLAPSLKALEKARPEGLVELVA